MKAFPRDFPHGVYEWVCGAKKIKNSQALHIERRLLETYILMLDPF